MMADGPSVLVVSHEASVYSFADRVYELREGAAHERPDGRESGALSLIAGPADPRRQ
jgi:hypothetical protein